VLVNVRVDDKHAALDRAADAVAEAESALGDEGRVLLRPSG
jgi:phosphoglucosamine mutase